MEINLQRIGEKLADLQKTIERLEAFKVKGREPFFSNEDNIHIFRSHFLIGMEAAINICYHLIAKLFKLTTSEYSACFNTLFEKKIISKKLEEGLIKLTGIRNRMIHRYEKIDYEFLFDNIDTINGIFKDFKKQISEYIKNKYRESGI